MKRGKKYLESLKLVDRTKLYDPTEALGRLFKKLHGQNLMKRLKLI